MKKIFSLLSLFLGSVFFIFPSIVIAGDANDYGVSDLASRVGFSTENVNREILLQKVGNYISIVLGFVGVIFLVFILYYGFLWMTAGGSTEKTKKAKDGIVNLVIGLLLIFSAYAITSFVLKLLTNVNQ